MPSGQRMPGGKVRVSSGTRRLVLFRYSRSSTWPCRSEVLLLVKRTSISAKNLDTLEQKSKTPQTSKPQPKTEPREKRHPGIWWNGETDTPETLCPPVLHKEKVTSHDSVLSVRDNARLKNQSAGTSQRMKHLAMPRSNEGVLKEPNKVSFQPITQPPISSLVS